ncbi:pirin family protein [Prauserella cavernicola]|uniref:Pirin family protein n=1 Tax=Prauserella cavernicola TaxID=2800127 RepID=A0A934QUU0_9PSEU|nr:pirin family protein [Prauserella cavernicola]MBK1786019.1 pirin family protein [Prauserella cavernicola]
MSNTDTVPVELTCPGGAPGTDGVEVLSAREVPLGGPRAMAVRRTLPQRKRSLIGAWCFADHFGPATVDRSGGMDVPPHPHTGLQTATWLFAGEVEHRDSLGTHAILRPGELNLMTGGHGICHSEVSTPGVTTLHGVQLWIALPDAHRHTARDFHHHTPPSIDIGGATARVLLGDLAGETSPVPTFTPLLGAEIVLDPQASITLAVDPTHEHGVLADTGTVVLAGTSLAPADLGYLAPGASTLTLENPGGQPARVLVLGGAPFDEDIVMWWNFVARGHDEIVAFREAWQRESDQFGRIDGYTGTPQRLPAPALPNAQILPRSRR